MINSIVRQNINIMDRSTSAHRLLYQITYSRGMGVTICCGLGLAKGWSAEKLEVLVTRYVSKLLKAKLTTLARNVNDVA